FEPQDHPNVIAYPGAPPTRPYDNAGWTLAFQMGVEFDRVLDGFTGPFEKVTELNVKPPAGHLARGPGTNYVFPPDSNNAHIGANRLFREGRHADEHGHDHEFRFDAMQGMDAKVEALARELGVDISEQAYQQPGRPLRQLRIALWDQYGGSAESGWTRWILE